MRRSELKLYAYLRLHAQRVISQSELIEKVFGGAHAYDTSLVRVHVAGLRRKLGLERNNIRTVPGLGYYFDPAGTDAIPTHLRATGYQLAVPVNGVTRGASRQTRRHLASPIQTRLRAPISTSDAIQPMRSGASPRFAHGASENRRVPGDRVQVTDEATYTR